MVNPLSEGCKVNIPLGFLVSPFIKKKKKEKEVESSNL